MSSPTLHVSTRWRSAVRHTVAALGLIHVRRTNGGEVCGGHTHWCQQLMTMDDTANPLTLPLAAIAMVIHLCR